MKRLRPPLPESQRGAALISAMLIVSVMALVSLAILESVRFSLRLSANLEDRAQARFYALGAEELASASITQFWRPGAERMPELDVWTRAPFRYPLNEGMISGSVRDGANCFNLNSLVERLEDGTFRVDPEMRMRFQSLLGYLGIAPGEAEALTHATVDWIDTDLTPGFGGAEDDYYGSLDPAYRTSGEFYADVSELRLVRGVDASTFDVLEPFVCVRPTTDPSALNLNTLEPWQAPLLAAYIGQPHNLPDAEDVLADRPIGGFAEIEDFFNLPPFLQFPIPTGDRSLYALKSTAYELSLTVFYREAVVNLASTLQISDAGDITTVSRRYGALE